MKRSKSIFNFIIILVLLSCFGISCDKVNEDNEIVPELSTLEIGYAKASEPTIIPLYGDFDKEDIQVLTSSPLVSRIETQNDDLVFLKYESDDVVDEQVVLEISNKEGIKLGQATVDIKALDEDDCADSGFSDYYLIEQDSTLHVDLMENDAFCDFIYTGSGGVRETLIANTDGVLLSISPSSATLTYRPPNDFTGKVLFIYELCYGWDPGNQDIWSDPIASCTYYYTALSTIEVTEKE